MGGEHLLVVGSSHRTAPLTLLESLSLSPEAIREQLPLVREEHGLTELVVLSTCNRTEVYASSGDPERAAAGLEEWLLGKASGNGLGSEHLFVHTGRDAAEHLFRTTAGLESMMVGETEIAGQVQDALELARETGTSGGFSTRLFSTAFRASKRARTETDIGAGTTSVASAAVHLAHRIFGDLSRRSALVIGAGETGRLVSRYLANHGIGQLTIANRTHATAVRVAQEFGGSPLEMDLRGDALASADVAVVATHSREPLITGEMVREALKKRGSRMLLLVDISMPHNIEASVGDIENVFLNDMTDLRAIVQRTLDRRAREIPQVEWIISGEVECFLAQQATLKAGPMIRELRERYEALGSAELDRFVGKLEEGDREIARRIVRSLLNKLLHWPTLEMRAIAQEADPDLEKLAWTRQLLGLDRPISGKGDK